MGHPRKRTAGGADRSEGIRVNRDSLLTLQQQVRNHILFAVATGRLRPGDGLMSAREVGERLGLNPTTVRTVYRELELMGILRMRRGIGVFVSDRIEPGLREKVTRYVLDRLRTVAAEARAVGFTEEEILEAARASYASDAPLYAPAPAEVIGRIVPKPS